jgi:hypothetical protein
VVVDEQNPRRRLGLLTRLYANADAKNVGFERRMPAVSATSLVPKRSIAYLPELSNKNPR